MNKTGKTKAEYEFSFDRNNINERRTFGYITYDMMDVLIKMGLINPIEDFAEIDTTKEEVIITLKLR